MTNIVVCFPGGASGHFIANLCSLLLFNVIPSQVLPNGSMHDNNNNFIKHPLSLEGRILDKSIDSYKQELNVIQELKNFSIAIGHFRYVNELVATNKQVIYITFDNDDKEKIYYNLKRKTDPNLISEQHYNAIKGSDWPSFSEHLNGNISPEFFSDRQNKDWLSDWFYKLPQNSNNTCEIKFKEIIFGEKLLEKLCSFLSTKQNIDAASSLIKQYRKNNG